MLSEVKKVKNRGETPLCKRITTRCASSPGPRQASAWPCVSGWQLPGRGLWPPTSTGRCSRPPLIKQGQAVKAIPLDVTDYAAFRAVIEETVAREGRLDYIFNNAGIAISGEIRDLSIDHWRRTLDVNLNGVVSGSVLAYKIMARQGFGHIVNISSIEGLIPFPLTVPYVTSKFAVMGLSKGLRVEGTDLGVKTSVVCPGFVATAIFESAQMVGLDRERLMELAAKPWERFSVTPDECARIILKGVARNKAIIPVTLMARVMWWLARLRPEMVINKVIRDFRQWRYKVRAEA